jgi:hypothetical protein
MDHAESKGALQFSTAFRERRAAEATSVLSHKFAAENRPVDRHAVLRSLAVVPATAEQAQAFDDAPKQTEWNVVSFECASSCATT